MTDCVYAPVETIADQIGIYLSLHNRVHKGIPGF
jgi:hypothetical protein